jgi:hypothetical protein
MKLCCLSTDDKTDADERHTLYLLAKSFYAEGERTIMRANINQFASVLSLPRIDGRITVRAIP